MTTSAIKTIILVVLLVILGILIVGQCGKPKGESAETIRLRESLAATRAQYQADTTRLLAGISEAASVARAALGRAAAAETRAVQARGKTDTLRMRLPTAGTARDSIDILVPMVVSLTAETADLRTANTEKDGAIVQKDRQIDSLTVLRGLDVTRLVKTDSLNRSLTEDLKKATECSLIFGIKCPSRKAVAITAVVVTASAIVYALSKEETIVIEQRPSVRFTLLRLSIPLGGLGRNR